MVRSQALKYLATYLFKMIVLQDEIMKILSSLKVSPNPLLMTLVIAILITLNMICQPLIGVSGIDPEVLRICNNNERPTVPVYSTRNRMTITFLAIFSASDRGFFATLSAHPGLYFLLPSFSLAI